MKEPKLDLSKPNCHCCGNPLKRDMKNLEEMCIHHSCSAKGVIFSIPFLDEGENIPADYEQFLKDDGITLDITKRNIP